MSSKINGYRETTFVVKVQVSVTTNSPVRQVLIYNENRSVSWERDANKDLLDMMDGKLKLFFSAKLIPEADGSGSRVQLLEKAEWQNW